MGPGQWSQQPGPAQPGDPNQPQGGGSQGGYQQADPAAYDQTAMYDPSTNPGMYSQGQPYADPYQQQANPYQQQSSYQQPDPYQQNPYQQPDPYGQGQYGAQQAPQQGWGDGTGWNAAQPAYTAGGNYPPNGPGYAAPAYGGPGGQPPKKNTGLIIGAIVLVVALIVGGVIAAVTLTGNDSKKSDSASTSSVQTTDSTNTDTSTDETTTDETTTDSSVSGEATATSNGGSITLSADGDKLFAIVVSDAQGVRTISSPSVPWTETFSPGDKTYFAVNPISTGSSATCKITQGGKTLAADSGTSARCSLILR